MAFVLLGGIVAYHRLGRLEDPEFTIKEALIITPYPGASADEVAKEVTNPIESACQKLGQLRRVESQVVDDFGDVYGIFLAIGGNGFTESELRRYAEFLRRELLTVNGVKKIDLFGEQQEVVFLELSRRRLAKLGIGEEQIYNQLQ